MANIDGLVDAYIAALPIRPIAIIGGRGGSIAQLGIARTADAFDALWFAKPQHAELVAMTCYGELRDVGAVMPDGWVDLHVNTVRDYVAATAAALGAIWRTDLEVRADASFEVEKIIMHVEVNRRTGGLAQVNKAYKAQRLAGQTRLSYQAHLTAFTHSLVMLAAQNVPA